MDFTPFSGFEDRCGKKHENIPKNQDALAPHRTGCTGKLQKYLGRKVNQRCGSALGSNANPDPDQTFPLYVEFLHGKHTSSK
jgi:hypothetical protein